MTPDGKLFFDPIKRLQALTVLRGKLEILKTQIALLDELQKGSPYAASLDDHRRLAGEIEAKIQAMEQRYSTVN